MPLRKNYIEDIVGLFINFLKLIPNPITLNYKHLKSLLIPIIDEKEFDLILKTIFTIKDSSIFRSIEFINMAVVNIKIVSLSKKINHSLTINQKTVFLTILIKLIHENNQLENKNLIKTLYVITETFELDKDLTDSILELYFNISDSNLGGNNSVLLTNSSPDYISIINGNKVIYNKNFDFKLVVRHVKNIDILLFKILELNNSNSALFLKDNDVIPYNSLIRLLLNKHDLSSEKLKLVLNQNPETCKRIEIQKTDLTPYVLLDSKDNQLKIEGHSIHLQPQNFYQPILLWIQKQKIKRPKKFEVHIDLSFFNTYTSKIILEILFQIREYELIGCKVSIYWHYESDDSEIKEAGEYYATIINKDFHYISYDSKKLTFN